MSEGAAMTAEACTKCGGELPDGAAFCPECGAASAAADAPLTPQDWPDTPPPYPPTPTTAPPSPPAGEPGPAFGAVAPAPTSAPVAADRAGSTRNTVAGIVGVAGAVLLGLASFLSWAQVTVSVGGHHTQTVSGWDWFDNAVATGPLFAAFALVAAALTGLVFAQVAPLVLRLAIVAVGALSLGLAAFAVSEILDRKSQVQRIGNIDVTLQYGVALLVVGGVAILGAGLIARHRPPAATA